MRAVGRGALLLSFALGSLVMGCGEPPAPAPSAVVRACPAQVCVGDDFTTWIHLDAKKSSAHLKLVYEPPAADDAPLDFRWSFAGSAWNLEAGTLDGDDIVVTLAAERPLHVTLRVENPEGGVAEALRTIAVTPLDDEGNCPVPLPEDDLSEDCIAIKPAEL
jgi:hypothetical protein